MAWALDFDTSKENRIYRMLYYPGTDSVFACAPGLDDGGLWERTEENVWTQRIVGVTKVLQAPWIEVTGAGCIWQGKIWFADCRYVYYSTGGSVYTTDLDIDTEDPDYCIAAMNAYGDYLYIVYYDFIAASSWQVHFARRDIAGTWTFDAMTQQDSTSGPWTSIDIIGGWGGYIYWSGSPFSLAMMRWTGALWEQDPSGLTQGFFTPTSEALYFCDCAPTIGGPIYRRTQLEDWTEDEGDLDFWTIAAGEDSTLWGADSRVIYYRSRANSWLLYDDPIPNTVFPIGVKAQCAIADSDNVYVGSDCFGSNTAKIAYDTEYTTHVLVGPPRGHPEALICDHQYGDTLYLGLLDALKHPQILWVDWDFADYQISYCTSSGSAVGVQTVELRNTCIAFGQFGADKQILVSEDKLETWDEAQGEFGNDEVTTLQFHPTNGQDLGATRRLDQDLIQTLTQRAPWTDLGTTPFVARSQLRVGDDIFIGSDTPNVQPVRMYSSGSWMDKSNGLPTDVAINDLELGY